MTLPLMGTIQAELSANTNSIQTTLHIVKYKGASGSLLGYNTAKQSGVLKIINQLKTDETSTQFPASGKLASLFGRIGNVKGNVTKFHVDPDVKPKQQPHRRVPFHVRKGVEMELKRLEELDIIEPVTGPTRG